ncbi:MAG: Smr/MutS family protein [Gammaproteobacteria bacterium]|nr:Smr/MutS family protein [Gammaproteobacteria bacterium]
MGEVVQFHRPGVQARTLKRLRRGQYPIERQLDLHGQTLAQAERALHRFLSACDHSGARCVRIVHGKGLSSPGGRPVLKGQIVVWLREHHAVNAFCSAPRSDGGTGAMYVLLSARR